MKLAVAITGESALPSAFVVWRGFEESIRKASAYGYHGVELALKTAEDIKAKELSKWLEQTNMEVSCISTGQVFATLGLFFTHPDQEVRKQVIGVFNGLIDLAQDFGGLVNVGRTRGFIAQDQSYAQAENLFLDTAERICEHAEKNNVTIIIEPVNRYEINFINNLDEGARLVAKMQHHNIGLMPDVFHMNIEDDEIAGSLVRNAALLRYIHFADSNRLAPGQGHLNFNDIFNGLDQAGFNGWASIEILPEPDPDTAARQAAAFILPMIEAYNQRIQNQTK